MIAMPSRGGLLIWHSDHLECSTPTGPAQDVSSRSPDGRGVRTTHVAVDALRLRNATQNFVTRNRPDGAQSLTIRTGQPLRRRALRTGVSSSSGRS
jgi:hypothetical protein